MRSVPNGLGRGCNDPLHPGLPDGIGGTLAAPQNDLQSSRAGSAELPTLRTALTRNLVATITAAACAALIVGAPVAAQAGDNARGEELFGLCAQCHGPDGAGMELSLAPAIAGLDLWYVEAQLNMFRDGLRGLHPDVVGGLRMYPMSQWLATDADLSAVAEYVASMPATHSAPTLVGGDAKKGATIYATCAACHGPDGAGMQAMNAPPLRGQNDWYIYESLIKFKAGYRGYDPKNINAALMRAMSNTIADDQAMRDVIAYITTLDDK